MNYDYFVWNADGLSIRFSECGCFQIHNFDGDPVHYKDMNIAISAYTAFKKINDLADSARQGRKI